MTIARADVLAEAQGWLGTPFHHGQWAKGVGADCIGFVAGVANALGMPEAMRWREDPRFRNYGPVPRPELLRSACATYLDAIGMHEALPGDVLLFAFLRPDPMHFAFVTRLDPRYILHAYQPRGAVVENILDTKWERRLVGAFRLRGIDG